MADQVDVKVKNFLEGEIINISRQLADGSRDMETSLSYTDEGQISLDSLDVAVRITAPQGIDMQTCPVAVRSDIDLLVSCSISNGVWLIKIDPNTLNPNIPTTANVNVGEDKPG